MWGSGSAGGLEFGSRRIAVSGGGVTAGGGGEGVRLGQVFINPNNPLILVYHRLKNFCSDCLASRMCTTYRPIYMNGGLPSPKNYCPRIIAWSRHISNMSFVVFFHETAFVAS
jgi:hypothetical protein